MSMYERHFSITHSLLYMCFCLFPFARRSDVEISLNVTLNHNQSTYSNSSNMVTRTTFKSNNLREGVLQFLK